MREVNALIITGYGINCEKEMAAACEMAGARTTILHAHLLLKGRIALEDYQLLGFPGGFSFGDELGAGKAFANRLTYAEGKLKEQLREYVDNGNCILGICNGFQLLVKLGLLPGLGNAQTLSLTGNDSGRFESRWVNHTVTASPCIFTQGIDQLYLPVRHGEGKLIAKDEETQQALEKGNHIVLKYADNKGLPTQRYPENPNGSPNAIAGLCDTTGRILGMMAHPEAALLYTNHPQWLRHKEQANRNRRPLPKEGPGLILFKNAIEHLKISPCKQSITSSLA
ncbi:MAG: phosphoribosylformylglycinamidine synthase I [Chlamydiales bacterium]|nr:phosphoribosylformylglycinamidine synthase I [Chlamydiia bacterium]MCP5508490.1 phosphoribosylformylglycinamidine synthase I [Chlamydiales bacterium]